MLGLKISNTKFTMIAYSSKLPAFWTSISSSASTKPMYRGHSHSSWCQKHILQETGKYSENIYNCEWLNSCPGQSWMHPMANFHQPSTCSIRPYIYAFLKHLTHQHHLHSFLPLTQTLGVSDPFNFCCSRKEVLKRPTSWIRSQGKRKGLLWLQ